MRHWDESRHQMTSLLPMLWLSTRDGRIARGTQFGQSRETWGNELQGLPAVCSKGDLIVLH